jgi:hypothetical protein
MNERLYKRLQKIRRENPKFDEEMMNMFAEVMPNLLDVMIDGKDYNYHIGSKEVAELAEKYITNNKDEHIGFHWTYDEVISNIRNYTDIDNEDFYPCDIWVWANVKYGDMQHITTDSALILKTALFELTDSDFPFYPASQRAYCWLKKHIENEN